MKYVDDWGGFEELVAKLHETGSVTVQRDVTIVGTSGACRQIDVLVTHTEGLYTHKVIVECRYWKRRIKRTHIDAMVATVKDVNASKGVFFTTKGFQLGAQKMAREHGIEIYIVRELGDHEWGAPGRIVDFFLQMISRSVGNLAFPGSTALLLDPSLLPAPPGNMNLEVFAGEKGFESKTPVLLGVSQKPDTLENLLDQASMQVLRRVTSTPVTFNNGTECKVYFKAHVGLPFEPPLLVPREGLFLQCPKIDCDVGVRIDQSRIRADRAEKYLFALAVEDCITGGKYAASRLKTEHVSTLSQLEPQTTQPGNALPNGSVVQVVMSPFFDFSELNGLAEVPMPLELTPK